MFQALLLALTLAGPPSGSSAEPTLERGKQLFNDIDLGANGKTCVLCHAGGKNFDPEDLRAATAKDVALLSNHCLSLRMKSQKLPLDSSDLQSLVLYVRTFAAKGR